MTQLKTAWEKLKLTAESQERDELLSKFDGKIAQGLKNRVAHAANAALQATSKSPAARIAE